MRYSISYKTLVVFVFLFLLRGENLYAISNNVTIFEEIENLLIQKNYKQAEELLVNYQLTGEKNWQFYRLSGKVNYYLGNYQNSIDDYQKSIFFIGNKGDSIVAYVYNNMGASYYRISNFNKAVKCFEKALNIKLEYFDSTDRVFVSGYNNIGFIYRRLGNFEKALSCFNKVEEILRMNQSFENYATVLMNKAILLDDLGRLEEAIGSYNIAIEIELENKNYKNLGDLYNNLGNIYLAKQDYKKALQLYKNCISIRGKHNLLEDETVYSNIGLCYANINDFNNSEDYYIHSLNINKRINPDINSETIRIYRNLAKLYIDNNFYKKARIYIDRSLQFSKENFDRNNPLYYNVLTLKADYHKQLEQYNEAEKYYNIALNSFSKNELRPLAEELSYLNISSKKADLLLLRAQKNNSVNDNVEALKIYTNLTNLIHRLNAAYYNESNQLRFIENKKNIINSGLALAYELYNKTNEHEFLDQAFYFAEMGKASVLNSSLNEQRAISESSIPDSLVQNEKQLNTQIAYYENTLYKDNGEMSETARDQLLSLYKEKENLVDYFEQNFNNYYNTKYQPLSINLDEFQLSLADDEVAFEYTLTDSNLFTFLISNNEIEFNCINLNKEFINDLFYLHNFVNYNSWVESSSEHFTRFKLTSNKVYQTLLSSVNSNLTNKRLIIIPDAELSYIPFEILLKKPDESINNYTDLSYLVKYNAISYKYSATTFKYLESDNESKNQQLVAFAPSYAKNSANKDVTRGSLNALKGAKDEIKSISRFFSSKKYLGNNASETIFKDELSKASIIHLALHGLINEEKPMLSKLVFSEDENSDDDDFLNMYEIFNLKMNLDLLVLSACNTGFGNYKSGEGIISFARSFIYAGCPSIVMTLWPINDLSGSEIMKSFYYHLSKSEPKDEALRLAKMDYLNQSDPTKTHPYFWAGYVNMGNTSKYSVKPKPNMHYAYISAFLLIFTMLLFFIKRR